MHKSAADRSRRNWLLGLVASGALGATGLIGLIRRAHALGTRPHPEGIQEFKGDVRINNVPAKPGAVVKPGDTVTTGAASQVVFVIGQDAYLLRERSRLQISGERASTSSSGQVKAAVVKTLNLLAGKVLAVFGKGEKRVVTPTATIGVRGTGLYVETDAKRTYVCTCYGNTVIEARGSTAREVISTTHHESPRYVNGAGIVDARIQVAPMQNHTDEELTMLEALLGRRVPFEGKNYSGGG